MGRSAMIVFSLGKCLRRMCKVRIIKSKNYWQFGSIARELLVKSQVCWCVILSMWFYRTLRTCPLHSTMRRILAFRSEFSWYNFISSGFYVIELDAHGIRYSLELEVGERPGYLSKGNNSIFCHAEIEMVITMSQATSVDLLCLMSPDLICRMVLLRFASFVWARLFFAFMSW